MGEDRGFHLFHMVGHILHWHELLPYKLPQTYPLELEASKDDLQSVADVWHFRLDGTIECCHLLSGRLSDPQKLAVRSANSEKIQKYEEWHLRIVLLFPRHHYDNRRYSGKVVSYKKIQDFPNQVILSCLLSFFHSRLAK